MKEGVIVMTCLEAQSNITAFINDQLDMATLEEFIEHVNHCADCREELEVYYTLLTAMKLLDEDKELSNQFSQELDNKLRMSADRIRKMKNARIRKKFYLLILALGFVIISSISVTQQVITYFKPQKPSFLLHYSGIPDKYNPVSKVVEKYDEVAKAYVLRKQEIHHIMYRKLNQYGIYPVLLYEQQLQDGEDEITSEPTTSIEETSEEASSH